MLLNRLDEYEMLRDAEVEDEEDFDEAEIGDGDKTQADAATNLLTLQALNGGSEVAPEDGSVVDPLSRSGYEFKPTNAAYLEAPLTIDPNRILDSAKNGVMMAWETPIMERTAALLAPEPGLRILNIGHGMGTIDTFFQETSPTAHHIIEAHPSILVLMQEGGWHEKPSVTIHAQKWQEAVPALVAQGVIFDAIYFDTFAEDYKALRDFFSDSVLGLLDDGGRWGFFNGLGADRQVCYDVYGKVLEMDLFEAGYDTEWETLQVPDMEETEEWRGVRRRYWALNEYRLPICKFLS
jgi:type IV protein arginine methyltransferase